MSVNSTELSRLLEALDEAQDVFVNYPAVIQAMSQGETGFAGTLAIMRALSDSGDTRKVRRKAADLAELLAMYLG